ncbi:helix-turn-helix domain-containing protein [Ligilactobacillus pobuzihii]|uniref:HTH cro/C1-type domain-containing protein n=1 Tax=Ligilactobacillus pobuzihii TaxID=449659 RepID=A0A0R2LBY7_9LACO|nr:helix-turn-helix transcriptional regulator [Ligilactobacillus pobuzihii]KRK10925.1 hypothetical protein FD11_GL001194 [Ligilactobacillus pobuzihii E100301 = KCTC 13174]KRN99471.1 hypothetical protein IV66_GL001474 [Ligilactobacillus pobuzihii]GEN48907.1 hypothetical protein LPO01_16990 [Ligilactobacillus pobuzihii]
MQDIKQEKFTLRQWRGIRGMSKTELSKRSKITDRTIALYEQDLSALRKAKYENLESLAEALNIRVDDIFLSPTSEKPKLVNEA